jgi:tripeptidyl-peptidase I
MKRRTKRTSRRKSIFKREAPILSGNDTQSLANCGTAITPACLKALYKIPDLTSAIPGNTLGIYEDGDYYSQDDLNTFFANYAPQIPQNTTPILAFIDGAMAPVPQSKAGLESTIDLSAAYPLIYPQRITLYQTDDSIQAHKVITGGLDGMFNTFLDALDGVSSSYPNFR